jgi:hypothetical protein
VSRLAGRLGELDDEGGDDADTPGEPSARVRPYTMVGGRTRTGSGDPTPVEAIVVTVDVVRSTTLTLEPREIARLCTSPSSVAEISAHLHIPVGVVRVLVADLVGAGIVEVHLPCGRRADGTVERAVLERVLAGLESL